MFLMMQQKAFSLKDIEVFVDSERLNILRLSLLSLFCAENFVNEQCTPNFVSFYHRQQNMMIGLCIK